MKVLGAVALAALVVLLGTWVDEDGRKTDALRAAEAACAPAPVQSYDVQGQSRIVYACGPEYRLRTVEYGHDYLWWIP